MSTPQNFEHFKMVPHNSVFRSELNVRKKVVQGHIRELAESIAVEGVLQNLVCYKEIQGKGKKKTERYGVVAGGCRFLAIGLLIEEGRLPPDYLVPIMLTSPERALSISLTENHGRQDLHPADQYEAFRDLVRQGRAIDDVAAAFSVTPLVVRQRLRLAGVHPDFLVLYRDEKANLAQLMALAVTDDCERQKTAWEGLSDNQRTPSTLRRILTESEIALTRPLATFVGLELYRASGGGVRTDLFAPTPEEGTLLLDPPLVEKLALQKLTAEAEARRSGAGAFIAVSIAPNSADLANYRHAGWTKREATAEEAEQLSAIRKERAALEEKEFDLGGCDEVEAWEEDDEDEDESEPDEETDDAGNSNEESTGEGQAERPPVDADELRRIRDRIVALEAEEEEISENLMVVPPELATFAGTLLCVDGKGALKVHSGLLKPEDADRIARGREADARDHSEPKKKGPGGAMYLRLSAHRTQALQATLMDNPKVALVVLCDCLVKATLLLDALDRKTALNIQVSMVPLDKFAQDVEKGTAFAKLQARKNEWLSLFPADSNDLFGWLLQQPDTAIAELLALCTALSVDAVEGKPGISHSSELAKAASLDMADWWAPTAEGYLGKIPKSEILAIVTTAVSATEAARIETLKKPAMAKAAETLLAPVRWVPDYYRETQAAA